MMRYLCGAFLFLCLVSGAFAKTEYRMASGDCENSTVGWWSVQRFDNGRLVETWGVDCNGREYHTFGRTVGLAGPLGGTATETGRCDAVEWFAVTARDDGAQTDCWGRDCNGEYWRFEPEPAAQAAPGPAPGGNGARGGDRVGGGRYEQVRMRMVPFIPARKPADPDIR